MRTSQVARDCLLAPATTQLERFLDVDASALKLAEANKLLKTVLTWGILGFGILSLMAWVSQSWLTLASLFFWIIILGLHFIPQAKRDVIRAMNCLMVRISFLDGGEKHLYVKRMDSVPLGRQEVAYQLGRDVF
ncbi:hypothetical protein [Pseudomonas sp. S1(2024)]|uniref:hypothetical protein n=1 Tax=Pseudomonas sp. S1(2024) TaxID=3390191 RepID=UPI00397E1814